jgi:hypothetical protein
MRSGSKFKYVKIMSTLKSDKIVPKYSRDEYPHTVFWKTTMSWKKIRHRFKYEWFNHFYHYTVHRCSNEEVILWVLAGNKISDRTHGE